jgi:methionyl-tRNA formyltransferase
MTKVRFLVIGDIPLATNVFRLLYNHPKIEVSAVLTLAKSKFFANDPWEDKTCLYDEAKKHGVKILHSQEEAVDEFTEGAFEYGISCRASIIYKPPFLNLFSKYLINMHGGILPGRSGLHIANHCIIEGDKQSGGTLHIINEAIDAGDLLAREFFDIESTDTSYTVYRKTQYALFKAFQDNVDSIIDETIEAVPQSVYIANGERKEYFNKKVIDKRKEIDLTTITPEELDRRVRGLDFPGHESAFTMINGNKIYMTTQRFFKT